jgi:hypothetical protein
MQVFGCQCMDENNWTETRGLLHHAYTTSMVQCAQLCVCTHSCRCAKLRVRIHVWYTDMQVCPFWHVSESRGQDILALHHDQHVYANSSLRPHTRAPAFYICICIYTPWQIRFMTATSALMYVSTRKHVDFLLKLCVVTSTFTTTIMDHAQAYLRLVNYEWFAVFWQRRIPLLAGGMHFDCAQACLYTINSVSLINNLVWTSSLKRHLCACLYIYVLGMHPCTCVCMCVLAVRKCTRVCMRMLSYAMVHV